MLPLCDVVYASDKASFFLPYAQLAQTPEGCASYTLPQALGMAMVRFFYWVYINIKIEREIVNIFLPIHFNICFGYSKEPSHRDGSFEYAQHIFFVEK